MSVFQNYIKVLSRPLVISRDHDTIWSSVYLDHFSSLQIDKVRTIKPVLSGHSKIDKTKVFKTNGRLMQVESIAECSLGAFCNSFDLY